jgi:predicted dehydrogenase
MALDLTPEQKAVGSANFQRVVGKLADAKDEPTRRQFMQGMIGFGSVLPLSAAAYFGYGRDAAYRDLRNNPVKAALIGCGDEGGVLASDHDPDYVNIVAVCDIRPSNMKRIFDGEGIATRRRGLKYHYGSNADRTIKKFEGDYKDLLNDTTLGIEMVIIALPLNLHHQCVMDCLDKDHIKGILCEKLMAWNITQCKEMIRKADEKQKLLAIGHQRHYSMLYAHANDVVKSGVLGDVRHIRALWHRNNAKPKLNAQNQPMTETANGHVIPVFTDSWRKDPSPDDVRVLEGKLRGYGWRDMKELVRWRLFRRTGGGLMAELGSHQLDACSIFLGKKHPIAVSAVGGKNFYQDEREVEDHVYCSFEFPGAHYEKGVPSHSSDGKAVYNDVVTVTYSSISTNDLEAYGECVMGTKGTLITEREQAVYLYGGNSRSTEVTANTTGSRPVLDASASTAPIERQAQAVGAASMGPAISFGYKEEISHLAYCIRNRNQGSERDRENLKPRCDGRAAMADAIIALTANQAMRKHQRIEFKDEWFDASKPDVPDEDMRVEPV